MTLNGYYFTATGITEYAFFHGDNNVLCVSHASLPDEPLRISLPSGEEYTLARSSGWSDPPEQAPHPGASFPFLGPDGTEAGRLYLLSADHFAVAVPGAALTGRIIHDRLRRSIYLTEMDDQPIARVESGLERILSRQRFGEWFPRRYVAEVVRQPGEVLLAFALSVPFLGFDTLEVQ